MKQKISFGALVIIGLLVAIGPQTIFKVCEVTEEHVMKCHWTAQAELGIGLALAVLACIGFISKNTDFQKGLHVGVLALGALVIAIPTVLIGVCGSEMMHCHTITRPVLIVLGVVTLVIAAVNIFTTKSK